MSHVCGPWSTQLAPGSVSSGETSAKVYFLFRDAALRKIYENNLQLVVAHLPASWDRTRPWDLADAVCPWLLLSVASGHACCLGGYHGLLSSIVTSRCPYVPSVIHVPTLRHFLECISGQWGLTGKGLGAKCPTPWSSRPAAAVFSFKEKTPEDDGCPMVLWRQRQNRHLTWIPDHKLRLSLVLKTLPKCLSARGRRLPSFGLAVWGRPWYPVPLRLSEATGLEGGVQDESEQCPEHRS